MNENSENPPPPLPPPPPPPPPRSRRPPFEETRRPFSPVSDVELMREEFKPVGEGFMMMQVVESLLRSPGRIAYEIAEGQKARMLLWLALTAGLCLAIYGMIIGTYSGGSQLWAAPAKVALGSLFSALICLPSLYIFSSLGRVDITLTQLAGFLGAMIALNALLLLGFAPVSWLFSQATESVVFLGAMHLLFWSVGLYFGVRLLSRTYKLIAGHTTSFLTLWCIVYVMVSFQVSTNLRPLIGAWDGSWAVDKMFFLEHWWTNMF